MCDVPKMLGHTDTGTFFRHRFRYHKKKRKILVPVPIINLQNSKILATKISSGTHFFPIPVPILFFRLQNFPRLFSGSKFFRYRFQYDQKITNSRNRYITLSHMKYFQYVCLDHFGYWLKILPKLGICFVSD